MNAGFFSAPTQNRQLSDRKEIFADFDKKSALD